MKVKSISIGMALIISLMCMPFFNSSVSALEGKSLYYETGEIERFSDLNVEEVLEKAISGDAESQYALGSLYYLGLQVEENGDEAVKWLREAAAQGNTIASRKIGLLSHFGEIVDRNVDEALKWYQLAAENGDIDASMLTGILYLYDKNDSEEATKWLKSAVEDGNTLGYFLLAEAKYISGDIDGALSWYKFAAEHGHHVAAIRLGNIYNEMGDFKQGVQWVNIKPTSFDTPAFSLEFQIAVYRKIWPNLALVEEARGVAPVKEQVVLAPQKEKQKVVSEKQESKEKDTVAVGKVAVVTKKDTPSEVKDTNKESEEERFDEKKYFFKKIINDRRKAKKLVQQSHLSLQGHDWSEAIKTASEAITLHPEYADAYNNRAWGYYEKGLLDESIADCNKALELDKNHFFALNNRGRAFQKKGDIQSALGDFDTACQKGLPEACENYKKITRLSPEKEINFLLTKSREEFANNNYDAVIASTTKLLSLNPESAEAFSKRCEAYIRKEMFQKASDDCAVAIELAPDDPVNYFNIGSLYEQVGDLETASKNYKKSCDLKSDSGCREYERLQHEELQKTASIQVENQVLKPEIQAIDSLPGSEEAIGNSSAPISVDGE